MNIIRDWGQKIKATPKALWDDLFVVLIMLLLSLASFGLGRLSVTYDDQGGIEFVSGSANQGASAGTALPLPEEVVPQGGYVASRSGSKYHLPWCAGAQSIKEENKIFFDTKEEAEAAGYTPASNCKGI